MFPSSNCDNPFESLLKKSLSLPSDDQNPSFKQDDPPFLFNFSSPFFDEHELPLNQIFFQSHQMVGNPYSADHTDTSTNPKKKDVTKRNGKSKLDEKEADPAIPNGVVAPLRRRNLGVVPRRRTGKKDRHSKICTAQGVRDRRMRLSLQVARKFFDLQDMLGYDKASKTIEWLITKSKKAIKELINDHHHHPQLANNISISDAKSESFLSECEVVSGIDHQENSNKDVKVGIVQATTSASPSCIDEKDERKTQKTASKSNSKESREKARARARCRAKEKMMVKHLENPGQWYTPNPGDNENIQKLGCSNSPFEGMDQESNSNNQERVSDLSPYEAAAYNPLEQQLAHDVDAIEKFLANSSSSSTSWPISDNCVSGYTDPNGSFMGFLGNWGLLNNDRANSIYSVTNQDSLAGNPSSVYSEFP